MSEKRYALVRVDGRLSPSHFEVETIENIWEMKIIDDVVKEYGDTKEQLIRKIETAVAIMRNKMENKDVYLDRAVASFILEFLGVEE